MRNIIKIEGEDLPIIQTFNANEIIDRFIADQDIKQKSKDAYKNALLKYFDWVKNKGFELRNITRAEILIYKEEMMASEKSKLTVGAYINSVRRFYEWAEAVKLYPNIGKGVKAPKRIQAFKKEGLTTDQVVSLLSHFKQQHPRDFALINLMVRTGLRTIEVSRINVGDIIIKVGKRILMIHGKGHDEKDAFVILTDKAYNPIKDYLATREKVKDSDPVFISESSNSTLGMRLDKQYISRIAKRGLIAIGLKGKQYTAHSLRHTTAVNLLRAGATIHAVQGVLRHVSASTTEIYTESIKDEMRILNQTEALLDNLF